MAGKGFQILIAGKMDGATGSHVFQTLPQLQNGADLLVAKNAAVIVHNGDQCIQIAAAAVVSDKGTLPGTYFQKPLPGQLTDAAVDHGAADPHLFAKLPFRGKAGAQGQLPG